MKSNIDELMEKLSVWTPTPSELSNALKGAKVVNSRSAYTPKIRSFKPGFLSGLLGDLGSIPGKALGLLDKSFTSLRGNALLGGLGGFMAASEALAPKAALKGPGIRVPNSFKTANYISTEKTAMKSLKDVLVDKIREAKGLNKTAAVKTASQSNGRMAVDDEDVKFFSKLAEQYTSTEKTAGAADWMESVAKNAIPGLQVAGLGLLSGALASGIYDKASDAYKRSAAYEQMFEEFPQLKEVPRETVDKYWNVLNDYAPKLTINPLVAGQFVENMLNYGVRGIDHNVASQLLEAENRARSSSGAGDISKMISAFGLEGFKAGANSLSN